MSSVSINSSFHPLQMCLELCRGHLPKVYAVSEIGIHFQASLQISVTLRLVYPVNPLEILNLLCLYVHINAEI